MSDGFVLFVGMLLGFFAVSVWYVLTADCRRSAQALRAALLPFEARLRSPSFAEMVDPPDLTPLLAEMYVDQCQAATCFRLCLSQRREQAFVRVWDRYTHDFCQYDPVHRAQAQRQYAKTMLARIEEVLLYVQPGICRG